MLPIFPPFQTKAPEGFPSVHDNKPLTTSPLQVPSSAMFVFVFIIVILGLIAILRYI
jgi:hypothetical protein